MPGLRPPLFYSPYEAAAWAILSARRPGRQMMAVRDRLSRAHGAVFDLAGQQLWAGAGHGAAAGDPGIGPFYSELIAIRGTGFTDVPGKSEFEAWRDEGLSIGELPVRRIRCTAPATEGTCTRDYRAQWQHQQLSAGRAGPVPAGDPVREPLRRGS